MKFKERQKEKRISNRFLVGFLLLSVLGGLAFYGIFKNVDFKGFNFQEKKVVFPVSQFDPLRDLTNKLSEKNIPINFPLVATNSGILATLNEGGQVFFSEKKDFDWQIESLQLILSRLKIEGKKVEKVDFRFDKPIVVY